MTRKDFDNELNNLLTSAEALIPEDNLPDLPFMDLAPDVHDWYKFESELWGVGENIRQFLLENKNKLNRSQIERIVEICLDKRAKRGRQSFVMLLGKKMFCDYAEQIVTLLNDDDVDGYVIDTLYKMGATEYADLIEPFLTHNRTWIRNEAQRYIQKYK
ncbi:MAG: hypothetical protein UHN02_00190 [Acutalibacteraceae bacterium]|nr:hypothetical protein [Acutalibacteraceae bacterium]